MECKSEADIYLIRYKFKAIDRFLYILAFIYILLFVGIIAINATQIYYRMNFITISTILEITEIGYGALLFSLNFYFVRMTERYIE